jgi:hypothetical protein
MQVFHHILWFPSLDKKNSVAAIRSTSITNCYIRRIQIDTPTRHARVFIGDMGWRRDTVPAVDVRTSGTVRYVINIDSLSSSRPWTKIHLVISTVYEGLSGNFTETRLIGVQFSCLRQLCS